VTGGGSRFEAPRPPEPEHHATPTRSGGRFGGAGRDPWADEDAAGGLPPFLLDPAGILARRWRVALVVTLCGLAATASSFWVWTPMYSAASILLVSSQEIPEEFIRSTVREDSLANMNAMVGRVLARGTLLEVLDDHHLYEEDADRLSQSELVDRMQERLEVAPSIDTTRGVSSLLYGVTFEDESAEKAAEVANALASLFVEASIARRSEQARRATELLKRELARNERELREHLSQLTELRRSHRGELPSELEANLHKLDLASQRRNALTAEIAERESRIAALGSRPAERPNSENEVMLEELRRQLARELAVNTPEHPNVAALRWRIEAQEKLVAEDAKARAGGDIAILLAEERRSLALLRPQLAEAEAQIAELTARIDRTPAVSEQVAALEEKEQVLREDYQETLRKVKEAELAESLESAQQGARISILEPAVPPVSPKRPRWLVVLAGVAATFALALATSVLLEFVDPVVVGAQQLQSLAGRPVLGSIPTVD
jgi:uncharacterized protein involved in exopolysaccharide biosynthesis